MRGPVQNKSTRICMSSCQPAFWWPAPAGELKINTSLHLPADSVAKSNSVRHRRYFELWLSLLRHNGTPEANGSMTGNLCARWVLACQCGTVQAVAAANSRRSMRAQEARGFSSEDNFMYADVMSSPRAYVHCGGLDGQSLTTMQGQAKSRPAHLREAKAVS